MPVSLAVGNQQSLPDDLAKSSEFPIFGHRDGQGNTGVGVTIFHEITKKGDPSGRSGLNKIRGWAPAAQTAVEKLQPYHRGNAFEGDPLWILHELDRTNKHRVLHSAVAWTGGAFLNAKAFRNVASFGPPAGEVMQIQVGEGLITTDTPVATFLNIVIIPIDPNEEVHMEVGPALQVAFAQGTPCVEFESVYSTLERIYTHVVGTVLPTLEPHL